MNERVVEILVYIMSEMRGGKSAPNNLEILSRDLLQRGYTENEISSAFSWLYERQESENEEVVAICGPTLQGAVRVLHDLERVVISPEGYGYLLQLKHLGILKPWAPTQSYGLVIRLDERMQPLASHHSRADGTVHGITSCLEVGNRLYATSKGANCLVALDVAEDAEASL